MTMFDLTDREREVITFALEVANLAQDGNPCDKHREQWGRVAEGCPLCEPPAFTEGDEAEFSALACRIGADKPKPPLDLENIGGHLREAEHNLAPVIGFIRMGHHADDEVERLLRSLDAVRAGVRLAGMHGADPVANVLRLSPAEVAARSDELAAAERARVAEGRDITDALRSDAAMEALGVQRPPSTFDEPCGCGATTSSECCARTEGYFTSIGQRSDEELRVLGEDDGCVAARIALAARKAS